MAKIQFDQDRIKEVKEEIQENLNEVNKTLTNLSETIIKETVKTGEAWQKLLSKALKDTEPLMKKQSDILFETVKGIKSEAEYGFERFEKLSGYDFSNFRKAVDVNTERVKKGFEYITDQTEDILTEVSKRGDEIVETVTDTAKAFAKEAEDLKDKAESKVKDVIKEVESRISDVAPQASPSKKKTTTQKTKSTSAAKAKTAKAKSKTVKTKTTAKKVATPKADDLKVIEGVGPKLAAILNAAGYKSYQDVAKANVADLKKVLDDAGSRYKSHNPNSWAKQAKMASQGKLAELKVWQANNDAKKA